MGRNLTSEAIVLKTHRIGEIHKSVTFLTPSFGIINAIAHGAYKGRSKLGGLTDPFNVSLFYLYYEPVKKTYKITDAEPRKMLDGIRKNLKKLYTASLWAETVMKTFAGGERFEPIFSLLSECLHVLDYCPEEKIDEIIVQFLYRYLSLIGYMPALERCGICSHTFKSGEALYIDSLGVLACSNCSRSKQTTLSPGAVRYLRHTSKLPVESTLHTSLEAVALSGARTCLLAIVQHIIEQPLKSLASSGGLL